MNHLSTLQSPFVEMKHDGLWQQITRHKPLALVGLGSMVMLIATTIGIFVDPTMVLNEPAWLKPSKFAISTALYSFTFLWLLTFIQGHRRLVKIIEWVTVITLVVELAIIAYQASQGERSHFNFTTLLNAILFNIMGAFIFTAWGASVIAAILLLRQKMADSAFSLALKLGLIVAVVGSGLGGLMTSPTSKQLQTMQALRGPSPYIGAHSVSVPDGGAGLPIVGWSTEGGDLRIGHFFGLHGMQVIPFFGWFITRRQRHLSLRQQKGLIWTAGLGYLGLIALLTWQALRGQPLIYPDALTLYVLTVLLIIVFGAVMMILRRGE